MALTLAFALGFLAALGGLALGEAAGTPVRKVIIDTDTGADDASALILAARSPEIEILGVTVLAGNVNLEQGTQNALAALEIAGCDAPVYKGASQRYGGEAIEAFSVFGGDGMGDMDLIHPQGTAQEQDAIDFILETVRENPGEIEIIALGPATNIALAMDKDPETMRQVKMIWSMGTAGLGPGNASPVAEFNVYADAPAYRRMLDFGVPVTIIGLDMCGGDAQWTDEQFERLYATGEAGRFVTDSFSGIREFYAQNGSAGSVMNCDSVAMLCAVDSDFANAEIQCHGSCITDPGETYAQVIFYKQGFTYDVVNNEYDYNVTLVSDVDAADYFNLYLARVSGDSAGAEKTGLRRDVVVLFTSDVHCGVDKGFTYVGLKAVKDAAMAAGNHVLLVDDGDSIQGEAVGVMTRGQADIELMNDLGYDMAIPGNHEFDYGMDRFRELTDVAQFPYISCNILREGEPVFPPYLIREFDGVKIGFVGATTPETLTSALPRYFQNEAGEYIYSFSQGGDGTAFYTAVQEAVDGARAEGAEYVFLIAHLGNEASVKPYTYADVIEHTNGIDAVLDGHSHDTEKVVMKNKDGKTVIRQACGTKLACIGWLRISCESGEVDTGLYRWNNSETVPEVLGIQNEMTARLEETAGRINAQLSTVEGHTAVELIINDPEVRNESGNPIRIIRLAETNLGDLCADAFRVLSGAEIGMVNGGSIRAGVKAGDITENSLLTVFPYGDKVTVAELTGRQILDALEWGSRMVPVENVAFLQVSGLTYEIHTYIASSCTQDDNGMFTGVAGEYRVKNVLVNGEPLEPDRLYTVATLDYTMIDHGDGHTAFDGGKILWESDEYDFELLRDYIADTLGGSVGAEYGDPYGQERIVAVETPD